MQCARAGAIAGLVDGPGPDADAHAMCHIAADDDADDQHPDAQGEDQPTRLGTVVHVVQILLQLQGTQYEHRHSHHGHEQIHDGPLIAWPGIHWIASATATAAAATATRLSALVGVGDKVLAAVVRSQSGASHHDVVVL